MDVTKPQRTPRVVVAKIGLDGHSRGAYVVAHGLRQAGMEVIYTGLRQTPSAVAHAAVQEGADVIGISSMVGAHLVIVKKLRKELEQLQAADIPIMIGGIIPDEHYEALYAAGVNRIFPVGTNMHSIIDYIRSLKEEPAWVPEIPGSLAGETITEIYLQGGMCKTCGRAFFPLRKNCPKCLTRKPLTSTRLSNDGKLQTFVIASVAPPGYDVPHAQGYIDLDEDGPRIFSLLTDISDASQIKTGDRVTLNVVERGLDHAKRKIIGYRFKPAH